MQKWEYKILEAEYPYNVMTLYVRFVDGHEIPDWKNRRWSIYQALNELGKEGWDLVNFQEHHYILKCPIE